MDKDEFNERLHKVRDYLTAPVTVNRVTMLGMYAFGVGVGMVATGTSVQRQMKKSEHFRLTKDMIKTMRNDSIPVKYIMHNGEQLVVALVSEKGELAAVSRNIHGL
jgi:hypothetical protein